MFYDKKFPSPLEVDRYLYICQEFDCMDDF